MFRVVGNTFSRAVRSSSTAALECKGVKSALETAFVNKIVAFLLSTPHPGVLQVEINRPKKGNSMNSDFWVECEQVFNAAADDEKVRSIVLTASGEKFWSAGIDLMQLAGELGQVMEKDDIGHKARALRKMILRLQRPVNAIAECPKPVIGAIHGACIGGAIDVLSACDIRYSSSDAWFTIKEVDVGLAADLGTLQRFPKIIGNDSMARELALTARKFDASEAKEIGFVSKVYENKEDTLSAALEVAKERFFQGIAEKSPVAVQGTKIVMNYARDHSVADGLVQIAEWNAAQLQSEDLMKSAQAAMMKQPLSDVEFEDL